MTDIQIDPLLCTRCGTCYQVCPGRILKPAEETALPEISPGMESKCISCGHCEAFCPFGAFTRGFLEDTNPCHKENPTIDADTLGHYLKNRRSTRIFDPKPVDRDVLIQILDIARYAASGGNSQPVEWLIMSDAREIRRVAGLAIEWMRNNENIHHPMAAWFPKYLASWDAGNDCICRDAPYLIIAHVPDVCRFPDGKPLAATDAIISLAHIDIASPAFGVGTCWAGLLTLAAREYQPLLDEFNLPEGRSIGYIMMAGYPRYRPVRIPERNPLKAVWR